MAHEPGVQWFITGLQINDTVSPIKYVPIKLDGNQENILNFGTDPLVENVWKSLDKMTS